MPDKEQAEQPAATPKAPQPHPYKSTTHEERFLHLKVEDESDPIQAVTVFLRKEKDGWYGTDARCMKLDHFSRATGRQIARRRYFRWPEDRVKFGTEAPKFEVVAKAFSTPISATVH